MPDPTTSDRAPDDLPHTEPAPVSPTPTLPEPGDEPSPPDRAGRYQVEREVARGGMGVVLRAFDPELGRSLAVKVLLDRHRGDPALTRRFLEEARVCGQLQHPGVPPVHDLGELPDGRPFFAMKLVRGHTLAELLRRRRDPGEDVGHFLTIFAQVCQAVAYAHSKGVLHRDLKPQNVMVGAFGEVQVMDWGLAKLLGQATGEVALTDPVGSAVFTTRAAEPDSATQAGAVLGTPAYMAPEQARGQVDHLDERTDVFGLGATLCEVLTGLPPYAAPTPEGVYRQATEGDLGAARGRLAGCGADAQLVRLACACLEFQPARRPRDAGEVARAVAAYQAGVREQLRQAELERASAQVQAREERKRRRLVVALAAAVVGLVALGGAAAWRLERQRAERRAEREREREQLRQEVGAALDQVEGMQRRARWTEAKATLDQAAGRLGESGPNDLRERVGQAQADLRLVARLDRIRLDRSIMVAGKFNSAAAPPAYRAALTGHGLDVTAGDVAELAGRVAASPVKGPLVAALDDWAAGEPDPKVRARLLAITRKADPDEWRDRFRDPSLWHDARALGRLAARADEARLSPVVLVLLSDFLRRAGGDPVALLRRAQRQYPGEFWLNLLLGEALASGPRARPDEAIGYYRAALAVRPQSAAPYVALGLALHAGGDVDGTGAAFKKATELDPEYDLTRYALGTVLYSRGDRDGAIAEYRKALALNPGHAQAHTNLGLALYARGDRAGAKACFRKALGLDPKLPQAHNNLGIALKDEGDLDGAVAEYRKALDSDPGDHNAHFNLGVALRAKGDVDGAIAEYHRAAALNPRYAPGFYQLGQVLSARGDLVAALAAFQKAVEVDPNYAYAHGEVGKTLLAQGRFADALAPSRRALGLLAPGDAVRGYAQHQVRECERLIELDRRWPAILKGQARPKDTDEQLALAELCARYKKHYARAAHFYSNAFTARPALAGASHSGHRYNAACVAAMAAAGRGVDAGKLDDKERAGLRRQALGWLRADLAVWARAIKEGPPPARAGVQGTLAHWQKDRDLADVRDKAALDELAAEERAAWRKLWAEVDALRKRTSAEK
jgi:serine/threonine-protein kinase